MVCISSSLMVCTSDLFARRAEGNAVGFDRVTTVLEEVSAISLLDCAGANIQIHCVPLHDAPQMAQVRITFLLPALLSSRLPQSVQKMSEPIADIVVRCCCSLDVRRG